MLRLSAISAIALSFSLAALPALAESKPATPAPAPAKSATPDAKNDASAAKPPANPVIATVNNVPIHLSDVQDAAQDLPAQVQQLPPQQLFPLLVNQLIDRQALLIAAKSAKLQDQPDVAAAMQQAADEKLENAYVQQQVAPEITDAAIKAQYEKQYAGKPGPEQVKARHILVKTKAEAEKIIDKLNHGADFAKLAEKDSIDPGAANGGELGWFSKDQMVPAFSDAAFALKPGQYTKTPVHTQFGWHVILCQGKRTAPTPKLDDVKDQIRQELADEAIKKTLDEARSKVTIKVFNADGTPADSGSDANGVNVNLGQ